MSYVLMTNHIHLLMTAARDNGVAAVMKRLGQRYVQHVNRTYQRTGGLFEGRFRSSLIETDAYLLACQRYVELNPVRASMVRAPGGVSLVQLPDQRAGRHGPLGDATRTLPGTGGLRRDAYRRLFEDVLSAELLRRLRDCTNGGFVIGSPRFERQVAAMVGRRTWKGSPGRPRKETDVGEQRTLGL